MPRPVELRSAGPLRLAHIVAASPTKAAGIWDAVLRLVTAQQALGLASHLLAPISSSPHLRRLPAHAVWRSVAEIPLLLRSLDIDLVHLHGCWTTANIASCLIGSSKPLVLSPHGMLMKEAFRHKLWKKWPYWHLIESRIVQRAAFLHATTEAEAGEIRPFSMGRPIVVAPYGQPSPVDSAPSDLPAVLRNVPYVLFLGRLHPIKNLESLLDAARTLPVQWRLAIAGPADSPYGRSILRLASTIPQVVYLGPIAGAVKWSTLRSAHALFLPSHSENFGNVVLEALCVGTPVVASRRTPWQNLESAGAGLWLPGDSDSLAIGMKTIFNAPEAWMSRRTSALALASTFSWERMASTLSHAYREAFASSAPYYG